MLEFLIISFRYFFVFYILYFLWQGVCYIRIERGHIDKDINIPIIKQKITILFIHAKAFFILSGGYNYVVIMYGVAWATLFLLYTQFAKKLYNRSCPLIWNGMFFLTSIGSIILFRLNANLASLQMRWLLFACIALCFVPIAMRLLPSLERLEYLYLIFGLGLLSSTFFLGTEEFGSLRWIQIGNFGFSTSELVSFSFILYLASVFRKRLSLVQLVFPSAMAVVHVVILVVQRNLGSALIFFMSYMVIMYISTGKAWLFALGLGLFAAGSTVAHYLFWHVQVRVAVWQNPWADVHGTGHQIIQSLFAIGTWGPFGSGLTRGIPGTVPVVARDLTFAAIAEEFGFIFAAAVIGVYLMVFYRGVHISLRCNRRYHSILAVGVTAVLAFQTFLIIAGTINFIPLTGVTVPFISYGGTSLLMSVVMVGLLQWIFSYSQKGEDGIDVEEYQIDTDEDDYEDGDEYDEFEEEY